MSQIPTQGTREFWTHPVLNSLECGPLVLWWAKHRRVASPFFALLEANPGDIVCFSEAGIGAYPTYGIWLGQNKFASTREVRLCDGSTGRKLQMYRASLYPKPFNCGIHLED